MQIIKNPKLLQKKIDSLRRKGKQIGFVPTMGALHEGHLSLIRAAAKENDVVVASIFVNPLQFGPKEDLSKYPRTFQQDKKFLTKEKTDLLFFPDVSAVYPEGFSTKVTVDPKLTSVLCGKFRPGHFDGVTTVVAKLFNIVKPHRVYFGAKDYQQATLIRRMIDDLDFDIIFKLMPTVRENDGLAMSSRNRYLSPSDRKRAKAISETLFWFKKQVQSGNKAISALRQEAIRRLKAETDQVQYFEVVDPDSLVSLKKTQPRMVAAAACFVGKTRLIDNVIMALPKKS